MTAQIGDSIRYAGEYYDLVGVSPDNPADELLDPERFGIRTFSDCTACWRGYVATYGLRENRLVLEELGINVRDAEWEEELKRLPEIKEIRRYLPPHRRGPKPQPKSMKSGPCGPAIHGVLPVRPADPYATFAFSDNYHSMPLSAEIPAPVNTSRRCARVRMSTHPASSSSMLMFAGPGSTSVTPPPSPTD
jgi:hypothetical protein